MIFLIVNVLYLRLKKIIYYYFNNSKMGVVGSKE